MIGMSTLSFPPSSLDHALLNLQEDTMLFFNASSSIGGGGGVGGGSSLSLHPPVPASVSRWVNECAIKNNQSLLNSQRRFEQTSKGGSCPYIEALKKKLGGGLHLAGRRRVIR